MTTVGSLCSGLTGLELGLSAAWDVETIWQSEVEPAVVRLLERHYPDIPNLGDLTKVRWVDVEPPTVLTAGYPCQPFSLTGVRRGASDERHLWPHVYSAVCVLRPQVVFLENVPGHLSIGFDIVLGNLAEAGYDAQWTSIRASDIGAPHARERLFIRADDTDNPIADPTGTRREGRGGDNAGWDTIVRNLRNVNGVSIRKRSVAGKRPLDDERLFL